MKAINYECFKPEEKATRSVKKQKNNFINVIGDEENFILQNNFILQEAFQLYKLSSVT